MISIITGGIKNVGDYLIAYRAKELLRTYVDKDILEINRFDSLDKHLEQINESRALILCGGPAYKSDIYEGVYKLENIAGDIEVPIIPFGIGWSGQPFGNPDGFQFTDQSKSFLIDVHSKINASSCRDVLTERIIKNIGVENVVMTGCPVWYDLNSIGNSFKEEFNPKNIVISTPAKPSNFWLNTKIVWLTKKEFPKATITLSYHRGIFWDSYTPFKHSIAYILMAVFAKLISPKIKIIDVAHDLNKIDFYDQCDFHIGFRVHAHLYFLSKRLHSILINEDGRGQGMSLSLDQENLNRNDENLILKVRNKIHQYKNGDLSDFNKAQQKIDTTFETMRTFLSNILS